MEEEVKHDNLSHFGEPDEEKLNDLASQLTEAQRDTERKLRGELVSFVRMSRKQLGQILLQYRDLYKHGNWVPFCKAIHLHERTAQRCMAEARGYKRPLKRKTLQASTRVAQPRRSSEQRAAVQESTIEAASEMIFSALESLPKDQRQEAVLLFARKLLARFAPGAVVVDPPEWTEEQEAAA